MVRMPGDGAASRSIASSFSLVKIFKYFFRRSRILYRILVWVMY